MEHILKSLVEKIGHKETAHLVTSHVKELQVVGNHATVIVDNSAPLHEFAKPENDEALRKGLEALYGDAVQTYEVKTHSGATHEREKGMSHTIHNYKGGGGAVDNH
jgi:hypothetical protein